jgi:hypothetical protein
MWLATQMVLDYSDRVKFGISEVNWTGNYCYGLFSSDGGYGSDWGAVCPVVSLFSGVTSTEVPKIDDITEGVWNVFTPSDES